MKFYIIVFLLFCAGNLAAQNNIESILRSIEKNNKELQASEQLTLSKTLCPTRMYHTNGNGENRPR